MNINQFNKCIKKEKLTSEELTQLKPYKVNNAIILAAGYGLRTMPLSRYIPKGLFVVKGEVLIERQIRQLKEIGIDNITIICGYLNKKFNYLVDKYKVRIINNENYFQYNNISSLYVARKLLSNTYILCSDLYFENNPFEQYVYDSYYACKHAKGYVNEDCITKLNGDYIEEVIHGNKNKWYLIGEAYFSNSFSKKFVSILETEYKKIETRKLIWDAFYAMHINQLPMMIKKRSDEEIVEFDTINDFEKFDKNFTSFMNGSLNSYKNSNTNYPCAVSKYKTIDRYNSATTSEHYGRLHLNENTFGPSPKCLNVLKEINLSNLYEYDMEPNDFLVKKISRHFSIPEDDIFIHNGSSELIKSIINLLIERDNVMLISNPGWSYYASVAKEKFGKVVSYNLKHNKNSFYFDITDLQTKANKYKPQLIIINSPHNPTGAELCEKDIEKIIVDNPNALVYLDQAYIGFSDNIINIRRLIETYNNFVVTGTFSKYYALAGIRIGYAFCNSNMRRIFELDLPLFRESYISRKIASVALDDIDYYENMSKLLQTSRKWFIEKLNSLHNVNAYLSATNFVLVDFKKANICELEKYLRNNGIRIRVFNIDSKPMARIGIANKEIMSKCFKLIEAFLGKLN